MTHSHYDAIVVGSGFGGSVTAYRLAAAGKRVCLLERGKRFAPGSFPRTPFQMAKNFWAPKQSLYGMFQFWQFKRLFALVGSGLGGGSLIYANVLIRKDERWFVNDYPDGRSEQWPISREDLDPHYKAVENIIGVHRYPQHLHAITPKAREYERAATQAGLNHQYLPLAVSFSQAGKPNGEPIEGGANLHGQTRYTCRLCGECDVGCNYGSKNSLDYNYLTQAQKHGLEIITGADVRKFRPTTQGGWQVDYIQHDFEADAAPPPSLRSTITCDRLILAAGALGSTHLMLRNAQTLHAPAPALGTRFCGNGDMLGLAASAKQANGSWRVIDANKGPVITGAVRLPDTRDGGTGPGAYIEDAGIPVFLSWLAESYGGISMPRMLWRFARTAIRRALHMKRNDLNVDLSQLLGDNSLSMSTLPMLGMGKDVPDGKLFLKRDLLECSWSMKTSKEFFHRVRDNMKLLSKNLGAEFKNNPLWWTKTLITVHPLGGCPMGHNPQEGVVDEYGQVFGNPGLYIADGAVMPGPVGPNPSLTIAALANRFADRMLETSRGAEV